MKKTIIGILIFALVSCTGNISQTQPVATANQIVITTPPPQKPFITTVIPDSETEGSSLKDINPTAIPENSPVPLSNHYDLPAWMKKPETNIVAALITNDYEETRQVAFYNAITGDSYEILMPKDVSGYFWFDNANFGFLSKDLTTSYRINLPTGQVFSQEVPQESTRFLSQEYDDYENKSGSTANELILLKDSSTNNLVFERVRWHDKSKSGLFSAQWYGDNNTGIEVIDTKTNQIVWQSPLSYGMYGTEFLWSPTNDSQLAFLQGKPEPLNGFITESMVLTIVDVITGKILSSYSGDFGILSWSNDGEKILYQNAQSRYRTYGYGFVDAPCVLFLELGEKRCLRSIPRLVPTESTLETTGVYEWGKDNQSIYFTYLYSSPKANSYSGDLCIYSLINSHIDCPTQGLDVLKENSIVYYDLSPDQQFIHFCYSASSILNDYADTAQDGIIKTDGTGFFSWTGATIDGGPRSCSYGSVWRPLP